MTTIFKSPVNSRQDAKVAKQTVAHIEPIFAKQEIEIESNVSVRQQILFGKTMTKVPFVTYSIICPDDYFGLNHNLYEVNADGFTISIENAINSKRTIELHYKLEFPC